MIINAILYDPGQPGVTPVEASFPVKDYDSLYRRLDAEGIGDAVKRDCYIADIGCVFDALLTLKGQNVNVDELDYLAKRLESFCELEVRQFEGTAAAMGVSDIESLINLTFCCQQTTVISDFSNLRAIGKEHYLNIHSGGAPVSELDGLNAERMARELILNEPGTITPYGVVYCNGMELEQLYTGQVFPDYLYDQCLFAVNAKNLSDPDTESTWMYLPMPDVCLERALLRGRLGDPSDISSLDCEMIGLSSDVFRWADMACETPESLNTAAKAIAKLDDNDMSKFYAAVQYVEPGSASILCELANKMDYFDFYPEVKTAEEYGRHMIMESGHFEYDAELDEFYDFEGYGKQRLDNEQGRFLEHGYICYNGNTPLDEIFSAPDRSPGQGMTMGGM